MTRDMFQGERAEENIAEARREVRYFSTDYPVDTVIRRFKERPEEDGDIFIPDYQRTLQWLPEIQSYFIESCLLRVPVPPLFFYEENGRLEVVDGSQRIRTLVRFANDEFALEGLERLDTLNSLRFSDLTKATARRFLNTPVRTFVLEESTTPETRVEMFRRLNTSAKSLTEAEIRKGAYRGPFLDLIVDCADRPSFVELAPGTGSRGNKNAEAERQELVIRFFVYLEHKDDFVHDVRKFLDSYLKRYNEELAPDDLRRMSDEFDGVMGFIAEYMPNAFFRTPRTKQVPRVRFEAVSVGTALALRRRPDLQNPDTSWLESPEFQQLVRTDASNSGPRLRGRIEFVTERLLA